MTVSYPLGTSTAEANLARARLQHEQAQTQLRNLELQIATQVRDLARQVQTNQKRVDTTRVARELARAAARGRGEEVRRRHRDQLLRLPGAARSGAGADERSPRRRRLQQVARRLRSRAGSAAARHVSVTSLGRSSRSSLRPGEVRWAWLTRSDLASDLPALPEPPALSYTPPVPKLSVTVITRNEAANLGAALESVVVGRRDRRRRLREHRRHAEHRAALHRSRRRRERGPATSRRRTTPRRSRATTGSCRSTPTSA